MRTSEIFKTKEVVTHGLLEISSPKTVIALTMLAVGDDTYHTLVFFLNCGPRPRKRSLASRCWQDCKDPENIQTFLAKVRTVLVSSRYRFLSVLFSPCFSHWFEVVRTQLKMWCHVLQCTTIFESDDSCGAVCLWCQGDAMSIKPHTHQHHPDKDD